MDSLNHFEFFPLGGLNRVGMNSMILSFDDKRVAVDLGLMFADSNDFGIQSLFPDHFYYFKKYQVSDVFITHGHEDHIGAVGALLTQYAKHRIKPPRIYVPPFALRLIEKQIAENKMFAPAKEHLDSLQDISKIDFKFDEDGLEVNYIPVRHSIPDTYSLGFSYKDFHVIHTSDFKLDDNEYFDGKISRNPYQEFLEKIPRLDCLLIDSTNVLSKKETIKEKQVKQGIDILFKENKDKKIFLTQFASNVQRLAFILKCAEKNDRYVSLIGRSLRSYLQEARNLKYFGLIYEEVNFSRVREIEELKNFPKEQQLVLVSGSQGEIRSSLSKMAFSSHHKETIHAGDLVVFSSKLIPGNEKSVFRLRNDLLRLGAHVVYGERYLDSQNNIQYIHASGHASSVEISQVIDDCQPNCVVPVHGELVQMLALKKMAEIKNIPSLVVENGQSVHYKVSNSLFEIKTKEELPLKTLLRFEDFYMNSRDSFIFQRKKMARQGLVVASFSVTQSLQSWPIQFEGIFLEDEEAIEEKCVALIYEEIKKRKINNQVTIDLVKQAISFVLKRKYNKKPHIVVQELAGI